MLSRFRLLVLPGILLLGAAMAFPDTGSAGTPEESQVVNISVISCAVANRARDLPKLSVTPTDSEEALTGLKATFIQPVPGIFQTRVSLPPGRYTLNVRAGFCGSGVRLQLLPHLNRNIVLTLFPDGRALYDFEGYVAGSLPISGVRGVSIFNKAGTRFHLVVDGNEYYGEGLPFGSYTLDIDLGNTFACRLPIQVKQGGTLLNVTLSDFRHCVGEVVHVEGEPEYFVPLRSEPKAQ